MGYPTGDLVTLATNLIQEAERRGAHLRLLGGLAFYIHSPKARQLRGMQREYKDLDFVVNRKGAHVLSPTFISQGWEEDRRFNTLHGLTRNLFYYQEALQADVFVRLFEQCHKLVLEKRLDMDPLTLPLADLLLTKLQIHKPNPKDIQDIFALVNDHEFGPPGNPEVIDQDYIADLTGRDWGWYTTIHDNLVAIMPLAKDYFDVENARILQARLDGFCKTIENAPKSSQWWLRDMIGRRVQWYEEPEEVNR